MVKRHLAGLIVAAVVAGSGVAAVAAAPGDGSAAPNRPAKEQVKQCREAQKAGQAPSAECQELREQAKNRPRRGPKGAPDGDLLRRAIHGDLVVKTKDGGFETVAVDKGVVESKGNNTFSIKRADGKSVALKVNDATKYKGVADFGALQTGTPAVVVSKDGTARLVGQRAPGTNNAGGGIVESDEERVPAT